MTTFENISEGSIKMKTNAEDVASGRGIFNNADGDKPNSKIMTIKEVANLNAFNGKITSVRPLASPLRKAGKV